MNKYIGFKMIEAGPMTDVEFNIMKKGAVTEDFAGIEKQGYKVIYPDGYVSWSPKDVFEKAYMQVGDSNTITQENVDAFISQVYSQTIGEKTTLVRAVLVNGFEVIESSSCVDAANYDEYLGRKICLDRIKNKVWELLGFLLQTAKQGIR